MSEENLPAAPAKPTLVELDRQYRVIVAEIEAAHGELTDETEAEFEKTAMALCTKVDGYGVVMARLEQEAAYWKLQEEHCAKAKKTFTNAALRLKERMKYVLGAHPDRSLQGDVFRFFLAKSADTLIVEEENLPAEYKTTKVQLIPDKEKISADLAAGKIIPGAMLKKDNFALRSGKPK